MSCLSVTHTEASARHFLNTLIEQSSTLRHYGTCRPVYAYCYYIVLEKYWVAMTTGLNDGANHFFFLPADHVGHHCNRCRPNLLYWQLLQGLQCCQYRCSTVDHC